MTTFALKISSKYCKNCLDTHSNDVAYLMSGPSGIRSKNTPKMLVICPEMPTLCMLKHPKLIFTYYVPPPPCTHFYPEMVQVWPETGNV